LKISADRLIAARWGDSDQVEPGDMVWAVGSPFGLDNTVTFGIVSAKGRQTDAGNLFQDFLQTDAAVNPGNSGGPLINARGEIVGINTAIVGDSYQGVSFSIPSAIAMNVYEQIKEYGRISRGYLGVHMIELTPERARRLELGDADEITGVVVDGVEPESPAGLAGIRPTDVITAWNGLPVVDSFSLGRMVAATEIGSTATVSLIRRGEPLTLEVVVQERPDL
jgi:S1-C subfamily serine protease